MRYRVQMHESVFSDSLLNSLLEEPIIVEPPATAPLELDGLGPGCELVDAAVAVAAAAAADDDDAAAEGAAAA